MTKKRLPNRRAGYTLKFRIGGQSFYLRTGEYPDGTLGEIFIDCAKAGSALRAMMSSLAMSVSKGLQHDVPLEEYLSMFINSRFEPSGPVTYDLDEGQKQPPITEASSILDLIFRDLAYHYLKRTDLGGSHKSEGGEL